MASTTVRYQMEKEQGQQLQCWSSNEELGDSGTRTNDNFFDEYVTFDPNDFLKDPQSPSAILNSLDDSGTNSSTNEHDSFPVPSLTENAGVDFSIDNPLPKQMDSLPAFLGPADPVLAAGSISDSELLRLEGISLKSPKEYDTAPSSPPLMPQSSPTKRGRLVDSVYATFRRATHRSKPPRTHPSMSAMEVFKRDPSARRQQPHNYEYTTNRLDVEQPNIIDNSGLPLSPPLTGKIPESGPYSNTMSFVTGNLEDPFSEKMMAPPAQMISHDPNSPMQTPGLPDDFFFPGGVPTLDLGSTQIRRSKQRNASSAEWPMDGIIGEDAPRQLGNNLSSFNIPDDSVLNDSYWWEAPSTPGAHSHHPGAAPPPSSIRSRNGSAPMSHNYSIHHQQQQAELPYEFTSDLSGLMIHMPQPRQPQAAVLSANNPEQLMATPTHHHHNHHPPHQQQQQRHQSNHHLHSGSRGHYSEHHHHHHHPHSARRPQPRAPSSGARHHRHHQAGGGEGARGSLTSPRKPSLHRSGSRSMLVCREDSASPSPQPRPRRTTSSSGSISVRKQRSWPRAPRTPNPGSSSSSSSLQQHSFSGSGGAENGDSPSPNTGAGGGGLDFVNFTAANKNLLMTGVAPSGSSKTKARREKEAADRRRRLSEAAVKAVQAAGGDVDKLVREGFQF